MGGKGPGGGGEQVVVGRLFVSASKIWRGP